MEKTAKQNEIEWRFEFPPEVQAEREPVLAALDRAMAERTPEAVQEAGALAWAWLARHPEDYAIWDAGEPIAMLADAQASMEAQKNRAEMEAWKSQSAPVSVRS